MEISKEIKQIFSSSDSVEAAFNRYVTEGFLKTQKTV